MGEANKKRSTGIKRLTQCQLDKVTESLVASRGAQDINQVELTEKAVPDPELRVAIQGIINKAVANIKRSVDLGLELAQCLVTAQDEFAIVKAENCRLQRRVDRACLSRDGHRHEVERLRQRVKDLESEKSEVSSGQ